MSQELQTQQPPANVYEGNGQLSVAVPLPGAHHDHIGIAISSRRLRVEAIAKYPQASQNYLRHDWHVGRWELDLELPKQVDPAGAHATLNLGVLAVMAPLADRDHPERRIAVEPSVERPR